MGNVLREDVMPVRPHSALAYIVFFYFFFLNRRFIDFFLILLLLYLLTLEENSFFHTRFFPLSFFFGPVLRDLFIESFTEWSSRKAIGFLHLLLIHIIS